MSDWQLIIYGLVGLVMAVLSGISGGGAGVVMTPLAILLGLSPAQAVSTGKVNGLAVTIGSLGSLRKQSHKVAWSKIIAIMLLAFVIGLLVPFVIKALDTDIYRAVLGVLLLMMIPVMYINKIGVKPSQPSLAKKTLGSILLAFSLFLQGAFSGGLGMLVNIVLMGMLGQTASEANFTKRASQLVLNVTVIAGVIGSGLIIWDVALVGIASSLAGGYVGGQLAIKKGDKFAVDVMLVLMFVSALFLIIGAL
jgi:uncharacterized membrane protein YfcA